MKHLVIMPLLVLFTSLLSWSAEITLEEWLALDKGDKVYAIHDDKLDEYESEPEDVADKNIKDQLGAMVEDATNNISTDEIESDIDGTGMIVSIGEPELSTVSIYKIGEQTVVIGLYLYQPGGATESGESPEQSHYDTAEEAEAAGIDIGADVCWSGHAYFLWDGKTWTPLDYSNWEGRGFSWCGW